MNRRRTVDWDEVDAYGGWKQYYTWQAGQIAKIKRRTHKRERREARQEIRDMLKD